jgi:hypothetical protein
MTMKLGWLGAAAFAVMMSIVPASAEPGQGLAGYWWNLSPPQGTLSHIVVTPYIGGIGMQAFGYCSLPLCPLGEAYAQIVTLGTMQATFIDKVAARHVTLTLTDATHLTFQLHTIYLNGSKVTDQSGTMTKEAPGFVGPPNPYH